MTKSTKSITPIGPGKIVYQGKIIEVAYLSMGEYNIVPSK